MVLSFLVIFTYFWLHSVSLLRCTCALVSVSGLGLRNRLLQAGMANSMCNLGLRRVSPVAPVTEKPLFFFCRVYDSFVALGLHVSLGHQVPITGSFRNRKTVTSALGAAPLF